MPTTCDGQFARQLRCASAQRGRLDPVYQRLSDHWTLTLQRLYPMWALIGPGLADPAHIELRSRTVYLDSDALLGTRAELITGTLERRRVLACLGAALHEVMHAKHTKTWVADHDHALTVSEDPADRQLAADRMLLEEPRMEAHGCRDLPPESTRGRFARTALSAAMADVILPVFAAQVMQAALAGARVTREMSGRVMTHLQARMHYGVLDQRALSALAVVWAQVLGRADVRALDALFARAIWIPDGEIEALSDAAERYRAIIGPPEESEPTTGADDGRSGEPPGSVGQAGPGGPGDSGPVYGATRGSDTGRGGAARSDAERTGSVRDDRDDPSGDGYEPDASVPAGSLADALDRRWRRPAPAC